MPQNPRTAFTLVEVAISIGILSFCVIAVVGLLPVGLKSVQNANEQAAASQVLGSIANSLRNPTGGNGTYTFSYAGRSASFALGGASNSLAWPDLTLEGNANANYRRLKAQLDFVPPANSSSTGTATISVAWPAASEPVWNSQNRTWSRAEGSVTSGIVFITPP